MKNLRKFLRELILEAGEERESLYSKRSIDFKKSFNLKANQESLKTLEYYHFCNLFDAENLLKCCAGKYNHSEINAIAIKENEKIPHFYTWNPSTIGFKIIPRHVSFLSRKDVMSGNYSGDKNERKRMTKDSSLKFSDEDMVLNADNLPSSEFQQLQITNRTYNWTEAHLAGWQIKSIIIPEIWFEAFSNNPVTGELTIYEWLRSHNTMDLPVFNQNKKRIVYE